MNETIIQSLNGATLVRVKPTFGGRHFYCVKRGNRTVSRTYDTIKIARKALQLFAHNSPYPIIPEWLKSRLDKYGHCSA